MTLTAARRKILSELCPTMFSGIGGHELVRIKGPRGGTTSFHIGTLQVSSTIVGAMIMDGLLDDDLKITERGVLALQDALHDA